MYQRQEIRVNQSQERNLSRRDKPQGVVVDTDWISLTVESGVEYTAEVTPVGEDAADTNLELYGTCTSPGSFGAGNKLTFTAPSSGIYYLKVTHLEETYGPDTAYTFKVRATPRAAPSLSRTTSAASPWISPVIGRTGA
ncbi:MAG: hypothetical protein R2854_20150 [Caldilineaceae bacterium]